MINVTKKSQITSHRILNACRHLLETGGTATKMSDVAKAAGVSRQAVYLHFPNRAALLIATTRFIDEQENVDDRLRPSRQATNGLERLEAFIDAWGNYIPCIYGPSKAIMAMAATDAAAKQAWEDRMNALRHGCEAAVKAMNDDGILRPSLKQTTATDILWTLLSVRNWEQFTQTCNWSQDAYISEMKTLAKQALMP